MYEKQSHKTRIVVCFASLALMTTTMFGCATHTQTGTLAGAGVGALIGQAIGRNTGGTLIGAGIGAGVGYLIGNDSDKKAASKRMSQGQPSETGRFASTKWKATKIVPPPSPPYETYIIEFSADGWLTTTETFADGTKKTDREHYRVVGDTLIINNPGYMVNAKYSLQNSRLQIQLDKYNAEFMQIN